MLKKIISEEEKGMAFKLLIELEAKKYHLVKISCGSLTLCFKYYWMSLSQALMRENHFEPSKIPNPLFRSEVLCSAGFEPVPDTQCDHRLHRKRLFSLKTGMVFLRSHIPHIQHMHWTQRHLQGMQLTQQEKEKDSYGHRLAGSCTRLPLQGMPCTNTWGE